MTQLCMLMCLYAMQRKLLKAPYFLPRYHKLQFPMSAFKMLLKGPAIQVFFFKQGQKGMSYNDYFLFSFCQSSAFSILMSNDVKFLNKLSLMDSVQRL